jgi:hypothetical protein
LIAAYGHLPLIATRNTIGVPSGANGHHGNLSFECAKYQIEELVLLHERLYTARHRVKE